MGRFCTGDLEYKFYFGIQPSGDILEYGVKQQMLKHGFVEVCVPFKRLKRIKSKVGRLKRQFEERFRIPYTEFRECCYHHSMVFCKKHVSKAVLTEAKRQDEMRREASLIELGDLIILALEEKKEDLWIVADS